MTQLQKALFIFLNSLIILFGLILLSISIPKVEIARVIANLYTPDGQFESFTLIYAKLRYWLIFIGLMLLLTGTLALIFHKRSTSFF